MEDAIIGLENEACHLVQNLATGNMLPNVPNVPPSGMFFVSLYLILNLWFIEMWDAKKLRLYRFHVAAQASILSIGTGLVFLCIVFWCHADTFLLHLWLDS